MKTYMAKKENVEHKWYLVDAEGQTLGRLASKLAARLRGKNKPIFTPHCDTGDCYIVINANKIQVTGNKFEDKKYYHHTGYPGGIREDNFAKLQKRAPERILELAVKGMLPKGPLGRRMLKKLKIYANASHPHQSQLPEVINL